MKQFVTGVVAAMAMGVMAETANTVTVTKFHQPYPYSGKMTVEYTVGGALPANAIADITLNTADASATFTQQNVVTGANTFTIDFASSFGGALLLTNASFVVAVEPGGVQLWKNGPYWAKCNVGASKSEEHGYYFWWGDTVGYTNTGSGWISVKDGTSISFTDSGTAASTHGKSNSQLLSAGYIDLTGNLVAAHDAATAHLAFPWRMPTDAEFSALIDNCSTTWIITNGVYGRLVTGKGNYANRNIFLPAAGGGYDASYWSSTLDSDNFACFLHIDSSGFGRGRSRCYNGQSVRPVREFAGVVAVGIVTYDPLPDPTAPEAYTLTTSVPVPYAWLVAHVPGVMHDYNAYEASAQATAANGWKVWECYALGLDPQVVTSDFRIASFPMKADGTPDWANVAFDPPQERWNVPDAPVVWKGAAQLEGPWRTVSAEDGSPGTACPTMRFFKAVVFGNADDDPGDVDDGVQLWEGGPYWATTNVGAEKPWEYGYYFWWGDTVGYARSGGMWTDYGWGDGRGYYDGVTWVSSTGEQMSSSPFSDSSCPTFDPTFDKDNFALLSAGYVDATGNLAPTHDAAHVHWGDGWRMPTDAEVSALISNCTTTWITTNGVYGRLVTGKGNYANRNIFLPAAGCGYDSNLKDVGSYGIYWSSTPGSDGSNLAWYLSFYSGYFNRSTSFRRYYGQSVRPVREAAP